MADAAPKKRKYSEAKLKADKARSKTRVNLGLAFFRWRELKLSMGLKSDSELAFLLLDSYLLNKSENRPGRRTLERSSSTETCESMHYEYEYMMNSPNEAEREPITVHAAGNGLEWTEKYAASQRQKNQDKGTTTRQTEHRVIKVEDEEYSTSLSVGDGHYLVDLGSSSEVVVDEESILQLLKSCPECNRQCRVTKHVKGLKLVVHQACYFCHSRCKWTNLPDDEDDSQINGNYEAHGQTNSAMSPSSDSS